MGNALPWGQPPRMDALRAKQSLYYGMGDMQQLGLINPMLDATAAILDQHADYVQRHADMVSDLTGTSISRLTRALYEDPTGPGKQGLGQMLGDALEKPGFAPNLVGLAQMLEDNPATSGAIDTFLERWKKFNSGNQTGGALGSLGRRILSFFENADGDPRETGASEAIRGYLSDRLDTGGQDALSDPSDFDQILLLISKNPDRFENLLDTTAKYSENGDLKDFLATIRNQMKPVDSIH